jgi:hypothetical protein
MFPLEIIDLIILHTDFETSITLNNEYTSKKLYNPDKNTWNLAADNGNLEVVKFLHRNRKEGYTFMEMNLAARNGHLDMVKWFYINRKEKSIYWAMDLAAGKGQLEIVEYFKRVINEREKNKPKKKSPL